MFKKTITFALAVLLMQMAYAQPAAAATKAEKEAQFIEKVKAGITKLGTGTDARVEVKLRDRGKLKGYISEANAESFTVVDAETGAATQVAYPQVKGVKGNNLSEGARIAIVAGLVAVAIISVAVFAGN